MAQEISFDPHDRMQIALGVFAPLVRVPFLGHSTYFQNGQGDGVIVLLCAGVGLGFSLFRNFKGTLGAGIASVALLAFTFIRIQMKMAEMQTEMQQKLAGNPFRGLAEAAMASVQFDWGWGVLLVGGGLMVASGLVGSAAGRRSCPHCAEQILVAASTCRFCGRDVDPFPQTERVGPALVMSADRSVRTAISKTLSPGQRSWWRAVLSQEVANGIMMALHEAGISARKRGSHEAGRTRTSRLPGTYTFTVILRNSAEKSVMTLAPDDISQSGRDSHPDDRAWGGGGCKHSRWCGASNTRMRSVQPKVSHQWRGNHGNQAKPITPLDVQ
jgi:hypothetical protein